MPTNQGIRLEDGECLQTAGPESVELDPEQAFATAETQLAVFMDDHCQLLPEREDLQTEDGPRSEQVSQGGEQGEEDCFHPLDLRRYRPWLEKVHRINQYEVFGRDSRFDLILCRNLVFTYFETPLQATIAKRLAELLMPGGCLLLGVHESMPGPAPTPVQEQPWLYYRRTE